MNIVPYNKKHYPYLVEMWQDRDWNVPPIDLLPETGLVCIDNNIPIAACFIYLTNSKGCLMEWLIATKSCDKVMRKEAVNQLLEDIIKLAKDREYKYINTFTSNLEVIDTYYKSKGFFKQGNGGAQGLMLII